MRIIAGGAATVRDIRRRRLSEPSVVLRGPVTGWIGQVNDLARSRGSTADCIVVLAPADVPLETLVSSPVIAGVPVGIMPASDTDMASRQLAHSSAAPARQTRPDFAVLAMWKPFYLQWGRRIATALRRGYGRRVSVNSWLSDRTSRQELVMRLARGPRLVIYAGHGRQQGWSGYRGVRWHHVNSVPSIAASGVVVALTCDNLKFASPSRPSFGVRWVTEGRCQAFVGAVSEIDEEAMEHVAGAITSRFATGRYFALAPFLKAVDADLRRENDPGALAAWDRFRIVGNPAVSW